MNLKSLSRLLPFPGKSSILVCDTDGFHLHGAIISRQHDQLKVDLTTKSEALEYRVAVNEVISQLRNKGWQGKDAILLTPAVLSALIELPVSPKHPRPPLQMQEMIRWEIEPLLMQHSMLWSVGQVLLALGHMNETQIADVLDRQQGKSKTGLGDGHGSMYSYKRYCELAREMGYITQPQIDECMAKQAWLRSESDDFAYGWIAQTQQHPPNHHAESVNEGGIHSWLVTGINLGVMQQWEAAFAANKVALKQVYPLVGCAAGLLQEKENAVLLECHDSMVSGMRIEANAMTALKLQPRNSGSTLDACLEIYHGLVPPEVKHIWLATSIYKAAALSEGLNKMLGREVRLLQGASEVASAGVLGAAGNILRASDPGLRGCGISVRGPRPPVWHRVEARAIAAVTIIAIVIALLELTLYVRHDLAKAEHARTAEAKKKFDAVVAEAQAKVDAVQKVKDEIKAKKTAIATLTARFDFFAIDLPSRAVFIRTMLEQLASTVSEDIVINAVEETPNLGFRVAGWGLSDTAAQQFIKSFKTAMAPWDTDVVDPVVRTQSGRLGLLGHDIHFRLIEVKPDAATIATSSAASANMQGASR